MMATKMKSKTYRVPIRYLNGNAADMLFWDAVYYLLETEGESDSEGTRYVETSNHQLMDLTGLSNKAIVKLRNGAAQQKDERYNLQEEEGLQPRSVVLLLRDYETVLSKNVVEKPISYVENGWLKKLDYFSKKHSRFPLAVINFFFRKPNGASIKHEELVKRCKHPDRKKPPDGHEIGKALSHLRQLGVIEPAAGGGYRLIKKCFDSEPIKHPKLSGFTRDLYSNLWDQNQNRAEFAEMLLCHGNFDLAHFADIFRDLEYVHHERELALLKKVVYRHRNKPLSATRWRACWKSFQQALKRKGRVISTQKAQIDFSEGIRQKVKLPALQIDHDGLLWAKVVLWVECPDFLFRQLALNAHPPTIQVTLLQGKTLLWKRELTAQDEVKRWDVTQSMKQTPNEGYVLILEADEGLRMASVDAKLEAFCL